MVSPHALYSILLDDVTSQFDARTSENFRSNCFEWPEMTYREKAASSLLTSFLKKLRSSMNSEVKERALRKFLQVSDSCKKWVYDDRSEPMDDLLLGEFKKFVWKFWHPNGLQPLVDHPYDILKRGGIGPGAAIGSPGGDFYSKFFSSRLSTTSSNLYLWYRRYIRNFPVWHEAEELRLLSHGDPDIVEGNRLSFVPKNDDIARTICTEPVLNMYYQLGFGNILSSRLAEFAGINLATQQFKNRALARRGSLDGSFSTIDLSSASDSMSRSMLRTFLPPDFFRQLERYACPSSLLPNGERHVGGMISTMGNGFTFPLQTMLFTCVVLAAFSADGLAPIYPRGNCWGNFAVNGDDIVCPTRITAKVMRLLTLLGFSCNRAKTFVEGPFRESCGGDYYNGRNLRGVYVKTLASPQDRYAVINQLNLFSTKTGILLKKTVQTLTKTVRFLPVPYWEADDSGIRIPFSCVRSMLGKDSNGSVLYKAWRSTPPPCLTIYEYGLRHPRSVKLRDFNPPGLFLSLLQGSVNEMSIPLKPKRVRYSQKLSTAPCWDSFEVITSLELLQGSSTRAIRNVEFRVDSSRFETVAYLNLFG